MQEIYIHKLVVLLFYKKMEVDDTMSSMISVFQQQRDVFKCLIFIYKVRLCVPFVIHRISATLFWISAHTNIVSISKLQVVPALSI